MAAATPLVPRLPRQAWLVLAGDTLSALGSGLTLPFFLIYVSRIRGIDIAVGGLALATVALVGFIASPTGGIMIDRLGARRALIAGLLISGIGAFLVILIVEPWHAFAAALVVGSGAGIVVPAQDALLATVVRPADRSSVFALRNATLNAGYALGALSAALIADLANPQSFVTLYVLDGLTYFAFIPILAIALRRNDRGATVESEMATPRQGLSHDDPANPVGGYRAVIRDRLFVRFWALMAFLVAIGFAQTQAGFPAYATSTGGITASALGIAFAANTITVVGAQLFILRLMAGRRRTTGMVLACISWGVAWGLTLLVGGLGGGTIAVIGFTVALVVFALGETFLAPSQAALLNDLATDDLRGRYNGLYDLAWKTGLVIGPAVAGIALSVDGCNLLFAGLVVACAIGGAAALRLARHLPPSINVVGGHARA